MSEDEGFRRYLQAGMAWFSVTQQKAEGILRDLADSGETAVGQAQKAFERIVERSRQGSEELRDLVRSEIREQVAALGLATKDDIVRLEAKLDAVRPGTPTPSAAPATPSADPATPAAGPAAPAEEPAAPAAEPAAPAADPAAPAAEPAGPAAEPAAPSAEPAAPGASAGGATSPKAGAAGSSGPSASEKA